MEITPEILKLAQIVWDYHQMRHTLSPSDCILALGSHDLRVANRAAELYLEGYAPFVIFSGGLGNVTRGVWTVPEADQFAAIAMEMGVPADHILVENQSTNTGENILFTAKLLEQKGLSPNKFIVVQKPYMERRSYATFKKHWPEKELLVTCPQYAMVDYPNDEISMERVINIMVGDLERIREYPALGFQVEQFIPEEVWDAGQELMQKGFTQHLLKK
jgi:uncharacterized SAM-binding protein YcdF (DUF218 family)